MRWTADQGDLVGLQREIAVLRPGLWTPAGDLVAGGCFVCFGRGGQGPGAEGDRGWGAAALVVRQRLVSHAQSQGEAGAPYVPGLLAAREGALLEQAVLSLPRRPDVLLVNATGRDHPRRAGLALHLGWALDLPTIGVTHRPLVAAGDPPGPGAGASSALWLQGEQVGWWLRTRSGVRPLALSAGWRTDLRTVLDVVRAAAGRVRTPEPIRQARRLARTARADAR
ncbi:MAG: endonuclease V [Gemmatimonadota bacterium]|nr:endonuclease V [Gemmatimonadota bacterium]